MSKRAYQHICQARASGTCSNRIRSMSVESLTFEFINVESSSVLGKGVLIKIRGFLVEYVSLKWLAIKKRGWTAKLTLKLITIKRSEQSAPLIRLIFPRFMNEEKKDTRGKYFPWSQSAGEILAHWPAASTSTGFYGLVQRRLFPPDNPALSPACI